MRFKTKFKIDLSKLKRNVERLKKVAPKNEILFMVKANAYGHGDLSIIRYCVEELGIKEFGLASLGEALRVRERITDLEFEIYVFSDTNFEDQYEIYLNNRITPVISNLTDLNFYLDTEEVRHLPLVLKFNTGMNRLGIHHEDIDDVLELLKENGISEVQHLMTHFANSYLPLTNKRFKIQIERFKQLKEKFKAAQVNFINSSCANSGAIEQKVGLEDTHIRPGLMLYGPSSIMKKEKREWDGEIISTLESNIIEHFKIKQGDPIGYGSTPCPGSGVLAIVAIGYGDGINNRFQGSKVLLGDIEGKIVGRINMDMIQVLFPAGTKLNYGDIVTLWKDDHQMLDDLCQQTGFIPYEIFLGISLRVPKVFI